MVYFKVNIYFFMKMLKIEKFYKIKSPLNFTINKQYILMVIKNTENTGKFRMINNKLYYLTIST